MTKTLQVIEDAFREPLTAIAHDAQRFVDASNDADRVITRRRNDLIPELATNPSNARHSVDELRALALEAARQEWRSQRTAAAEVLRSAVATCRADLDGWITRAKQVTVPDPTLSDDEKRRLMTGEQIVVLETRRSRLATERLQRQLEFQPLTIAEQLDALEHAQTAGDVVAVDLLEHILDRRLAEVPQRTDVHRFADHQAQTARLSTIREARVPADLREAVTTQHQVLDKATANALMLDAQERIAAGDTSNAAVIQLTAAQFALNRVQREAAAVA